MRNESIPLTAIAALSALLLAAPGSAQYREYYLRGKVVDTQKKPVPGVQIRIRDVSTSRDYQIKTDKDGAFKFAGLPHGVYEVHFTKDGYAPRQDEWKFETPQDTMQKVEIPDVVLASQAQVREAMDLKEAEAGIKQAAEKIRTGDVDAAMALLEGVLEKKPEDANALFFKGLGYVRKKMYAEAVPVLTRVTELTPSFPASYFELGVCYRNLGEPAKALESYQKNMELDASNTDSAYNAGLILFETNRVDEAMVLFQRGLAVKPADAELLEMAGRCYVHQAKFDLAVEHLEKARAAATDAGKIAFLDQMIGTIKTRMK
jgi:tetratricopeptide (TPR) repeat protein